MTHTSEHWRNPETGYVECQCCEKWALDVEDLGNQVSELKRTVKRLMRPVMEEECPRPMSGHITRNMVRSWYSELTESREGETE